MPNGTPPKPLDIGSVLARSVSLFARDAGVFVPLALVIFSPYFVWTLVAEPPAATETALLDSEILATTLAVFILQLLLTGAVAHFTLATLAGGRATLGACLAVALDRFPVIVGLSVLQALMIGLPTMLAMTVYLAAPALGMLAVLAAMAVAMLIAVTFWVAVPAAIGEHTGALDSLRRSAILTGHQRGRLLGLVMILLLLAVVLQAPAAALVSSAEAASEAGLSRAASLLGAVITALVATLGAIAAAVAYDELRRAKDRPAAAPPGGT